jgi:predicted CoA-binding protein
LRHQPPKPAERTVVVLGASPKPTRYAYMAVTELAAAGYRVIPIHPKAQRVDRVPVVASLEQVREPVDTLTLYIGPSRIGQLIRPICDLAPGRVILNPGAESKELERALDLAGIPHERACTLVLLRTHQF